MKRLYFIRHGLSSANKRGIISGSKSDHFLSKEGKAQAKSAGEKAKSLSIDLIVSSTQSRALQTAKIIAKEIGYPIKKILANSLFVERDFGDFEGKKAPPTTREIVAQNLGGVETDDAIFKRAEEAYIWLQTLKAKNILVVSHGSFGRALRKIVIAEHDYSEFIPNAEIVCWVED